MGHTAKARPPPAAETHAVPLANDSRSRHPPAWVDTAPIDPRSRVGLARSRSLMASRHPGSVDAYSGGDPDVRMALKIDTWQCSVGVAALRDDCGVGAAGRVVFRLAVADDSFSSAELSGRLRHAHTR
jgi:hypothetical protein